MSTSLKPGDEVPDFTADSTLGPIHFHDYIHDHWAILFSHPNDFAALCRLTTEVGAVGIFLPEFEKRGVKPLGLSCDDRNSQTGWIADIVNYCPEARITYPILSDPHRHLALKFGILDQTQKDYEGSPLTARVVFIIGPDKRIKLSLLYPASTGRNFREVLRVIESLQLAEKFKVGTPVGWRCGDSCIVSPSLSEEEAQREFPNGFRTAALPSGKGYMRWTPQPQEPCP